jgi:Co/Zn/Cd efflux system component
VVIGVLQPEWGEWFAGLEILPGEPCPGQTTLIGPILDQAELHGIIARVRDLGLPLVSTVVSDEVAPVVGREHHRNGKDHPACDDGEPRRRYLTRALRLEYATIGWNIGEAVLTIALGSIAGSLALIGFGSVSIIEVFASSVVVWHMLPNHPVDDPGRTARALRLVAVAFGALAVALAVAGARDLLTSRKPDESPWGIAYLAMTALVMFGLAIAKHRLARRLDSAPLRSEATMTFIDGVLSTATMTGLALNAVFGWWWADPGAALLVAFAAANEARENWREAGEIHRGPTATSIAE